METIIYFEDVFGNFGGIEKMIVNIAQNIDSEQYRVKLIVNSIVSDEYIPALQQQDVEIIELQEIYIANPILRHLRGVCCFGKYIKNEKKCNIIHFHISNAIDLMYVWVAKRSHVLNRIAHSHNSSATDTFKIVIHNIFKRFLCNVATEFLACSEKAARWLYSDKCYRNHQYTVIKNAIDIKKYQYDANKRLMVRKQFDLENKFVVGHIGRFNMQKNHKFLIDVFEAVKKRHENAVLFLIGEGELIEEVGKYTEEKNLMDSVIFFGVTSDIPLFLQGMDVFVLPSLYEGLPVVLIETQAASLPSLVADTISHEIDVSEYIRFMSLEEPVEQWAEQVLSFSDIKREDGTQRMYSAGYDISEMVKQLEKVYADCLGK